MSGGEIISSTRLSCKSSKIAALTKSASLRAEALFVKRRGGGVEIKRIL